MRGAKIVYKEPLLSDEELLKGFLRLAEKGYNVKQILKKLGYKSTWASARLRKLLGMYPSIYISRLKRGKTKCNAYR